jgi:exopolysaccharide biosynthesis polyprenyl glycosylphosphotransferase
VRLSLELRPPARVAEPVGQEVQAASVAADRFALWRRDGVWRDALLRRLLAVADVGAAMLGIASLGVVFGNRLDTVLWASVFVPVWIVLAKVHGLYDRDQRSLRHLTVDEIPTLLVWALTGTGATALLLIATPVPSLETGEAFRVWLVACIAAFFLRGSARFLWRRTTVRDRALIIGGGRLAEATRRKLELFPDIHVEVAGERGEEAIAELRDDPEWARRVDRVILASQTIEDGDIAALLSFCRRRAVKLSVVPPARGIFGTAVRLNHVADLPLVEYSTWDASRSTLLLKRLMDVAAATVALVAMLPLFALAALAIRVDSRGPVFFRQQRAGQNGREFTMVKFRTMVSDAEERLSDLVSFESLPDPVFKLRRDPRVTRVGRVLRRSSVDELPQLWNVLRGDMSLVGPRPEQVELVERYRPEHRFRLTVRPGMTGPMQVYGRGELTFEERLAVEREYVENLSVGRDLRLIAMTVGPVVRGRGAY